MRTNCIVYAWEIALIAEKQYLNLCHSLNTDIQLLVSTCQKRDNELCQSAIFNMKSE